MSVSNRDKAHLRKLANRQLEFANLPVMKDRAARWYRHNDFESFEPTVSFEFGATLSELVSPLECETDETRHMEMMLKYHTASEEFSGDDTIVPDFYWVTYRAGFRPFDIEIVNEHVKDDPGSLGFHTINEVTDLESDWYKLKKSTWRCKKEESERQAALCHDIFGDILPIEMHYPFFYGSLSRMVLDIMGMENMMTAMYDYPELFKEMMDRAATDFLEYTKWSEDSGLLTRNDGNCRLLQGTYGFTHKLGNDDRVGPVKLKNIWGYLDSQETVGLSPDMFYEFFLPYYKRIADPFGQVSYGCCEPVDLYWDGLSGISNMKKVSISPWCNEEQMGEQLRGRQIVYLRKPMPNYIGLNSPLDEAEFEKHIRKTCEAASGCHLEVAFRDVYTLGGYLDKPKKAVEIVRKCFDKYYK